MTKLLKIKTKEEKATYPLPWAPNYQCRMVEIEVTMWHVPTSIVIAGNHQWMIGLVGKVWVRNRIFAQSHGPQESLQNMHTRHKGRKN